MEFMGNTYINEYLYYHQTERAKIKYDPHDLSYIYVYQETGEFLCKAEQLGLAGWKDVTAIKTHKKRLQKISKLSKEIMGIREDIRDDLNLIDGTIVEDTKVIENKSKKERILIGEGIYLED